MKYTRSIVVIEKGSEYDVRFSNPVILPNAVISIKMQGTERTAHIYERKDGMRKKLPMAILPAMKLTFSRCWLASVSFACTNPLNSCPVMNPKIARLVAIRLCHKRIKNMNRPDNTFS